MSYIGRRQKLPTDSLRLMDKNHDELFITYKT